MPHYAIVIADPDVAHAQEVARNVTHQVRQLGIVDAFRRMKIEAGVRAVVGPKKASGDLHTHLASECPDGLPNCRHCGDPAHADACRAAGHCPHCGTRHGIAPEAVLAANGYALVEVEPPTDAHEWDRETRTFRLRS